MAAGGACANPVTFDEVTILVFNNGAYNILRGELTNVEYAPATPAILDKVARIRAIAERRNLRVLLSTHNPALMDALPDIALSDVVFCFRDPKDGNSRLVRLGDIDEFPGLVSQGPLGQLVTTGVVDRFIKSPHTPEERKQRAMDWLARL